MIDYVRCIDFLLLVACRTGSSSADLLREGFLGQSSRYCILVGAPALRTALTTQAEVVGLGGFWSCVDHINIVGIHRQNDVVLLLWLLKTI